MFSYNDVLMLWTYAAGLIFFSRKSNYFEFFPIISNLKVDNYMCISGYGSIFNFYSYSLSHTQKEVQCKIEHYVKMKSVVHDICETFFLSVKKCQLPGRDFLGLWNIDWFNLNYK